MARNCSYYYYSYIYNNTFIQTSTLYIRESNNLPNMGFIQDFKVFLSRGSVIDLAVGVVIGASFTAVVNAMVGDLFAPLISICMPMSFENLFAQVKCPKDNSSWMPFNCKASYETLEE